MMSIFFTLLFSFQISWAQKIQLPEQGAFVGAYVDAGPLSDLVNVQEIINFENQTGKQLSWVYFSNNWLSGKIEFPAENVEKLRKLGRVPYIRLMPWSEVAARVSFDPIFSMDAFLNGKFDDDLKAWAREALKFPGPYILEFGPEVNGDWFPWNGRWNGEGQKSSYGQKDLPDGPEKFRDVYRRVIDIFRAEGLKDVNWVLHVDSSRAPHTWWNKVEYYYPGDDYIDWIGLSVFGAQLPNHQWQDFLPKLKNFWPEIKNIAERKPIIISEFAVIESRHDGSCKAQWLNRALRTVEAKIYPIKGVTYWNSPGWLEDGSADFRVTSSPASFDAFVAQITRKFWKTLDSATGKEKKDD